MNHKKFHYIILKLIKNNILNKNIFTFLAIIKYFIILYLIEIKLRILMNYVINVIINIFIECCIIMLLH